jgi:hypothetical protein
MKEGSLAAGRAQKHSELKIVLFVKHGLVQIHWK